MTRLARETGVLGDKAQAIAQGTLQFLTVDAAAAVCRVAIGASPVASSGDVRFRVPPMAPEYFAIEPGQKVAAHGGTTGAVSLAVGSHTTLIRVLYDDDAGVLEIMEAG